MKYIKYSIIGIVIILLIIPFTRVEKDIPINSFNKTVTKNVDKNIVSKVDINKVRQLYKISKNSVESFIAYEPTNFMSVEEIVIMRQTNSDIRKQLLESANNHIKSQIKAFEGYGVKQTKLLKKAEVFEKGNYVIVIVDNKSRDIKNELEACF
ncbi:MAG: DUF4358 domain-containing protein [Thomasclavelia sp.]|jgi:hypothetical protein|nr:DUF4358 domain-containing protein [Thomasclavelia sp.]